MGKQMRDALKSVGLAATRGGEGSARSGSPLRQPSNGSQQSPGVGGANHQRNVSPLPAQPATPARAPQKHSPPPIRSIKSVQPRSASGAGRAVGVVEASVPRIGAAAHKLTRTGQFGIHPLLDVDSADHAPLPPLPSPGVVRQLTDSPENETDLTIGLDFGTSTTKVVIRDRYAACGVYPVCFNASISGIDGYLLRSRVFRTGDTYSLNGGSQLISDLKLRLLGCKARSPVTEFNNCCAFLALAIRRAKGWLFTAHHDVYARHQLNWRLNLGLAARSYEGNDNVTLFRRLAWAAASAAADVRAIDITTDLVDRYRLLSIGVYSDQESPVLPEGAWSADDVDAVPEVSAQLQGFMTSARWDWASRPIMMMVDVGAGTVDSALFHVRAPASGPGVLTFFSSRVEPNGVMNLHRERVDWLRRLMPVAREHEDARTHLDAIAAPTDRIRPIPSGVRDYLSGYSLESAAPDVDESFQDQRYRKQIAGSINDAKVGKGLADGQLVRVPLLLCGGGSRMEFYARVVKAINETQGWKAVSVELTRLPVPGDLAEIGWHAEDFDRLSVAYGLSLAGDGDARLGRIVRAIEVPDFKPLARGSSEQRFVSKDQM